MSSEADNVDTGPEVAGTQPDKTNTGALGTLVAVGLFAMISITAAVTALVRHDIEEEEASKATDANQVVTDLKAAQRGKLNGPAGYVDRGKGLVSLPIDLAKGLVVGEIAKDPNSATPPALVKPDPSAVQVTGAAVDGGAGAVTLGAGGAANTATEGKKAGAPSKPEETKNAPTGKPRAGQNVAKPKAIDSAAPSPPPAPTTTAATSGAESPGPTNK
jgi:hypothetical protein